MASGGQRSGQRGWQNWRRPQLALIVLVAACLIGYLANAARDHELTTPASSGAVALSKLPPQAATTVGLVRSGGPFPYAQDGVVFGNAERHLPTEPRGFYHEYTVPTPGATDRGARRMITGQNGTWYYTADHYESFVRVDVAR